MGKLRNKIYLIIAIAKKPQVNFFFVLNNFNLDI